MTRPSKRILILGRGAMGTMFRKLLGDAHPLDAWHRQLEADGAAALESLARGRW